MANLFRNELALILGILVAKQFSGKICGWKPPGLPGGGGVYIPDKQPPKDEGIYGTGRGGYYKDHDGDVGRPGLGDEHLTGVTDGLSGQGGTLSYGGSGLRDGLFGLQWFINNPTNIPTVSAGGGGGWYGGGWSNVGGGGGGGSSFVLSDYGYELSGLDTKGKIKDYYLSLLPEDIRKSMTEDEANEYIRNFFGIWYDRQEEAYGLYPCLYDLNTRERTVLEAKNFRTFIPFREALDGNGAVLVSKVNKIITFDNYKDSETGETLGKFNNLDIQFNFTGQTQELDILEDGQYHIIAYGGAGCDRWRGPDERYHGGYGGCASGLFNFKAGTKLYVNVGSRGYRQTYRFKNSSIGTAGYTGGGSSSDVRYDNSDEASRIIVAGGGGGVYAQAGDSEEPPENLKEIPTRPIDPERDAEGNYVEQEEETKLKNMKFMVNDRSTVHVLVKSYNQIEIPDFAQTSCSIYINDGIEGEMHTSTKPGGGVWTHEFQFKLNKIYTPNTPTHEVTIEAIIKSNFYSILATDGIMVWVTTEYGLSDVATDNKIKILNYQDDFSIYDYYEVERLSKRTLTLEIEDYLGIEDFAELVKKMKGTLSKEVLDLLDMNDFYQIIKQTKGEASSSEYSEEEIEDELVISLVHLEYLYSNVEDTFELNDYIEIFIPKKINITGEVEPIDGGTIQGLGVYEEGSQVNLVARPNDGYQVDKWQINGVDYGTDKTLVTKADADKLIKLILKAATMNSFDLAINKSGSSLSFTNESAIPWTVNEGSFGGVKSGAISHSGLTEILTTIEKSGIFYYDYQVSSESGYDRLNVYRNGNQLSTYSGSGSGSEIALGVAIGDIIKFTYTKDGSASSGDDAGYIKNVYIQSSDGLDEAAGTDGLTFTNESAIPWVPNKASYGGIRSGKIYDGQTTELLLECPRTGTLNFEYSVESESGYDNFFVYLNGNQKNRYTGYTSGIYTLEVTEGDIVKLMYSKDSSGSSGVDAVYLKDIKII